MLILPSINHALINYMKVHYSQKQIYKFQIKRLNLHNIEPKSYIITFKNNDTESTLRLNKNRKKNQPLIPIFSTTANM